MHPAQAVTALSCVPYPWVGIVVSAQASVIVVLAAVVRSVYNRMNRLTEEQVYRLERDLADERNRHPRPRW